MRSSLNRILATRAATIVVASEAVALAVSLIFNLWASRRGLSYPFTWFLFEPADRFADFFKLTLAYPGAPIRHPAAFWQMDGHFAHYADWLRHNLGGTVNNHHVPPMETLLALAQRFAITLVDPMILFVAMMGAAFLSLVHACTAQLPPGERLKMSAIVVLAYPTLFAIDRGHLYSVICAAALLFATLRVLRDGRMGVPAYLAWAVAMNFRPNAVILCLILWLAGFLSFRRLVAVGTLAAALFVASFAVAHLLYPFYTPASFLGGLRDYGSTYVTSGYGLWYGSSLWGLLRMLGIHEPAATAAPLIVGAIFGVGAAILWRTRSLSLPAFLYLAVSAYALSATIFADYHLLIYLLPLVIIVRDDRGWRDRSFGEVAALVGSVFVLLPKNILFMPVGRTGQISMQVFLNPLVLTLCALLVLASGVRNMIARQRIDAGAGSPPASRSDEGSGSWPFRRKLTPVS